MGFGGGNGLTIAFEIDPKATDSQAPHYTTLKFLPKGSIAGSWVTVDGSTSSDWALTGDYFAGKPCGINVPHCSLSTIQKFYPDATIYSVAIAKASFARSG